MTSVSPLTIASVSQRIFFVRGHRVMLDVDLARLYRVSVKALNQAVKRNQGRFPSDFLFRLTPTEWKAMRSQFVTASKRNVRYLPYAFTEHGAYMLGNVLKSPRATEMSVFVVRAFVRLRETLATNRELARKLDDLESTLTVHDKAIGDLFQAVRRLMQEPMPPEKPQIGFTNRKKAA